MLAQHPFSLLGTEAQFSCGTHCFILSPPPRSVSQPVSPACSSLSQPVPACHSTVAPSHSDWSGDGNVIQWRQCYSWALTETLKTFFLRDDYGDGMLQLKPAFGLPLTNTPGLPHSFMIPAWLPAGTVQVSSPLSHINSRASNPNPLLHHHTSSSKHCPQGSVPSKNFFSIQYPGFSKHFKLNLLKQGASPKVHICK